MNLLLEKDPCKLWKNGRERERLIGFYQHIPYKMEIK